ncbi:PREDICTED: transmembrane protein 97-like [Fragaria vesca subsp. vesca]|uniref:transmembrane protein 97-like n=1 Tax=Fragaria vesca subsp. vesca TaxID=101020 RepID=UPI0002C3669C|nr:PREDICTED: transmembrane protein 97-like [Fragaria vesca subsp. vesca]
MGAIMKLVDAVLCLFFIIMIVSPMVHAQFVLPLSLFPEWMVEQKKWYMREFNDYFYVEKPDFFIGLVLVELLFQWPLALAILYGMLSSKNWYNTTCLVHGASFFTTMVTALAGLIGSGKASDKVLTLYYTFLGFAVLTLLRGLMPPPTTSNNDKARRKRIGAPKKMIVYSQISFFVSIILLHV